MIAGIKPSSIIRLVLIILMMTIIVIYTDLDDVTRHIQISYIYAITATIPVILCALAVVALRHKLLLTEQDPPYKYVIAAIILSTGFNYILPARSAELLKATYLREKCAVPFSAGTSAVFMERLVDILIIGCIGSMSFFLHPTFGQDWKYVIIILTIFALFVLIPRSGNIVEFIASRVPWRNASRFLYSFHGEVSSRMTAGSLYMNICLGMLAWMLNLVAFMIFFNLSIPQGLPIEAVITVFIASVIGIAIPILPGGLGTFEAAIIIGLKLHGIGFDEALALATTLRITLILAAAPPTFIITLASGTGIRSLMESLKRR